MLIGGRYETLREIGRGGAGKTYLADDTYRRGGVKCVVKKFQPPSKLPVVLEAARKIFETHAQYCYDLGKLDPFPKTYEHLEQGGEFYLVQELIDGHDLRQAFTLGDRWDEKEAIALLREILTSLTMLHERSIVHQDLGPRHLIRRWSDKRLMLLDLGGFKHIRHLTLDREGNLTAAPPVGTTGYMAQEQLAGQPQFASDVYAAGMMGIQAVTGYMPNQLPRHPQTQAVEWHDQARVSSQLIDILDRMVVPDADQRFQTAADALAMLPAPIPSKTISAEDLATFLQEPDEPTYQVIVEPQFDVARDFSEGLAAVVMGDRLGYIDPSGTFEIPPMFRFDAISLYQEGAYQFSEGLARVAIDHQWGYINKLGKLVIPPKFDSAENFMQGLARVELAHKFGYIYPNGSFAIYPDYKSAAYGFSEDMAGVEIEHRYGYINKLGRIVIEPQFDSADEFCEGLARITLDGKYGFINKLGKLVIPAQFDVAHSYSEGLARVRMNGKYGYVDAFGNIAIAPQFDDTFSFSEGMALVRDDDRYGFINLKGDRIIPLQFEDAYPFSEGIAAVNVQGKWGFINKMGEFLIEPQFQEASSIHNGRAAVRTDNLWGYLGTA
ncbi:MAG: WG repeat-containing protein [Kaiparowitsia implicata GSE-PSE-MK54-09C]|jgi:serine/threonine-protein kinase|nr:WG repeat-containing protein [Kaiparowitsia implicata GSE-PSE-MK54-09C]